MNIGIVTTWFERGAAYVSRQYRQALEPSHRIFIFARGGESARNDALWNDLSVTWAEKTIPSITTHVNLDQFKKWIVENKIDVVFFNEQHWWEPVLLCADMKIKTGSYIDYYTESTIPLFGLYDFLLCNTKRHLSAFDWHPQAFFVPWGTDTNLFSPKSPWPEQSETVTFFHSSGYNPFRKGTDSLVRAFEKLQSPEARLLIHTQRNLKKYFPDLAPFIEKLEKHNRLICKTEVVPAPGLYHLGDIYVYPSRLDGIGLTLAEALACGLPSIATDHPPMNEFLDESSCKRVAITRQYARADGYYWPQCDIDIDDLARAMQEFIASKRDLPDLKQKARAYAEEHLSWEKNAQPLPRLFEEASLRSDETKVKAYDKARQFENNRKSLVHSFPRIYSALQQTGKCIRRFLG